MKKKSRLLLFIKALKFAFNSYSILFSYDIPKPYSFTTEMLQSDTNITQIVLDIGTLLPQYSEFISQFNNVINQSGISVITDSTGNMSIEVPKNMPDSVANNVSLRIGIIDRIITTRGEEIDSLFRKGMLAENKLKLENSNYVSQLTNKLEEYKRLKASYKH